MLTWSWPLFWIGWLGALAPEIVRLYAIRMRPERFAWSWFYVIVSLGFATLGGVIASMLPAANGPSAFYAGLSTPTFISTLLKRAQSGGTDSDSDTSSAAPIKGIVDASGTQPLPTLHPRPSFARFLHAL